MITATAKNTASQHIIFFVDLQIYKDIVRTCAYYYAAKPKKIKPLSVIEG